MRKLLLGIVICLCLSVVVFAHPGKTDSNGGHTDHSTGEYHYHHGYPEHQHSDMDGDGILDCPYNFVDITASGSGESSKTETNVARIEKERNETITEEEPKKEKTAFDHIKAALSFVYDALMFCMALFFGLMCMAVVVELIVRIYRWLFKR